MVTQSDIQAEMENADVIIVDIMGDTAHPLKDELNQLLERNVRTIIPTHYSYDGQPRYYGSATIDEFLQIIPSDLTVVRQGSILQKIYKKQLQKRLKRRKSHLLSLMKI